MDLALNNLKRVDMPLNKETELIERVDTIYKPLRSGRIWHKVNF